MLFRVARSTDLSLPCSILPDMSMLLTLLLTSTLYFLTRIRRGRFLLEALEKAVECVEDDILSMAINKRLSDNPNQSNFEFDPTNEVIEPT